MRFRSIPLFCDEIETNLRNHVASLKKEGLRGISKDGFPFCETISLYPLGRDRDRLEQGPETEAERLLDHLVGAREQR